MTSSGYDAVLVVSFGGPESEADVMPFLDNVMAGRPVPPPVKARIAARYKRFGGVSPINAHTRAFIAALERDLATHGPDLPVYWGKPQLAPIPQGHGTRDGCRRCPQRPSSTSPACSVPTADVANTARTCTAPWRGLPDRAAIAQAAVRLQPSGFHHRDGGPTAVCRGQRRGTGGRAVHSAQPTRCDGSPGGLRRPVARRLHAGCQGGRRYRV